MKVYTEITSATDFEFWAGARTTVEYLFNKEVEMFFNELDETYPDGLSESEVNDFFWFETDYIAKRLGYSDFDELMKDRG